MIYLNEARVKFQSGDQEGALLRVNAARILARSRARKDPAHTDTVTDLESVQKLHNEILEQSGDIGALLKIHREYLDLLHQLESDESQSDRVSEPLKRAEGNALALVGELMGLAQNRLSDGKVDEGMFLLFMCNDLSGAAWNGAVPNPAAGLSLAQGKWIVGQILLASGNEQGARDQYEEALTLMDQVQSVAPDLEGVTELREQVLGSLSGAE